MTPEKLAEKQKNIVELSPEGGFQGVVTVFTGNPNSLSPRDIAFDVPRKEPVREFTYRKPVEDPSNPFGAPLRFEESKRSGYVPLVVIDLGEDTRRFPNHLHVGNSESNRLAVMAINTGNDSEPSWETRVFPQDSINPEEWEIILANSEVVGKVSKDL